MNIRLVREKDFTTLVHIFKRNTPEYFGVNEIGHFEKYLRELKLNSSESYFVMEENKIITGSAGYYIYEEDKLAAITWIFFHPNYHGRGMGKMLVDFLMEKVRETKRVSQIRVRTSQKAYRFFERSDFNSHGLKRISGLKDSISMKCG